MHIQLFSDDPFAALPLQKRLSQDGLEYGIYQPGEAIMATHFVLFSPIWCNEKFVVCDSVWKKYFEEYRTEQSRPYRKIRLITAGYERAKHENYLCLLDMSDDLPSFFKEASPAYEDWLGAGAIISQLEGNVLYPKVMNKMVGVPSVVVIIAIIIGAKLAGIWGVVLAVPLASILMELADDFNKKKSHG